MALLVRPEPFSSQDFNRLFNTLLEPLENGRMQRWSPPMDLVESEDHFVLKADLPGLSEDDVAIEVHDGTLRISGERQAEHEQREKGWYRVERSFGKFSRSMTLPDGIDPDRIDAKFDRGVLEVRIPKPEERKPRRISIATAKARPETLEGAASDR
ncbi:MAG: Hsp20/alpha crystallin family protein [Thermoleophilaceae bacterium]